MLHRIETTLRQLRRRVSRTALLVKLFSLESPSTIVNDSKCVSDNQSGESDAQSTYKRGLVMVQIDGLSLYELKQALARNEMPFLSKLIKSEHYRLHPLYSGLPSSTPSVQGELFYGVKTAVPAFAFVDAETDRVFRMYEPECADAIETQLKERGEGLLVGGSAYCNIYTGGAMDSHFCAASLGWSTLFKHAHPLAWTVVAVLYFPLLLRTFLRIGLEFAIGLVDLMRGLVSGFEVKAEFKSIFSRVAIGVLLRDFITIGACVDVSRGLPIIHLNLLGYDEQAHRRGPQSAFAHWSLKGIDRCVAKLWSACHRSQDRHYDLWVYSDHGQEVTKPYQVLTGQSLVDAVSAAINKLSPELHTHLLSLNERIDQRRTNLLGGRWLQRLFPTPKQTSSGKVPSGSSVIAMGPVGHVYLDEETRRVTALELIAKELVTTARIPAVAFIKNEEVHCQCRSGLITLPGEGSVLFGASHPALSLAVQDLVALIRHPSAGQLVILGWAAGCEPISFPRENGSHAGIGPRETEAFALLPDEQINVRGRSEILRPIDLRHEALALLGRTPSSNEALQAARIAQRRRRPRGSLRVMSYNVHSCVGMDSRVAPERIARVIGQARPDIVALQELDVSKNRTGSVDQARLIANLLDMQYHFYPTLQFEEEKYGDAIITHLPISAVRTAVLPTPLSRLGSEPRGVLWLTLDLDDTPIQILNTHLGLYSEERLQQVRTLLSTDWLDHLDCTGPTILCGDMNASIGAPAIRLFSERMDEVQSLLMHQARKNTFSGRLPQLCIDHIWVRDVEQINWVNVPNTELTRLASDHLPLIADMKIF